MMEHQDESPKCEETIYSPTYLFYSLKTFDRKNLMKISSTKNCNYWQFLQSFFHRVHIFAIYANDKHPQLAVDAHDLSMKIVRKTDRNRTPSNLPN